MAFIVFYYIIRIRMVSLKLLNRFPRLKPWFSLSWNKISSKYRQILIIPFLLWGIWTFVLGILGGWLLTKGGLDKFPELTSNDSILITAPHIDDETIGAGGIILSSLTRKAKIKVVYMTNGDDNIGAAVKEEKSLRYSPKEFVQLGEQRMGEGKNAMKILGLKDDNLIFLGYPDKGLKPMLGKFYSETTPFVSSGTRFNHNPYSGTYKPSRIYAGENVVADLKEIIDDFKPTVIIVSHPRDSHPDHQACFQLLKRALEGDSKRVKIFAYLVHFRLYPPEKKLLLNSFLYPPKKLFTQKGWFSHELTTEEENKKLEAINQYQSQLNAIDNLLKSFVRRNEIFEEME